MSDEMSGSYAAGMVQGLAHGNGIDPGLIAMLENSKDKGAWGDGSLIILFLILMMWGRNGFGGNAGDLSSLAKESTVIGQNNFNALMDAISSTGARQETAIGQLAGNLNTDVSSILSALAGVDKEIAVNRGDITSAIQQCCCNVRQTVNEQSAGINANVSDARNVLQTSILDSKYATSLGLKDIGFGVQGAKGDVIAQIQAQTNAMNLNNAAQNMLIQQQTQTILNQMAQNQTEINSQFCAIRTREDQREIQSLRDRLSEARDASNTSAILAAIANKDTIGFSGTVSGSTVSGSGTLT